MFLLSSVELAHATSDLDKVCIWQQVGRHSIVIYASPKFDRSHFLHSSNCSGTHNEYTD